jgi:hypothetical protein
MRQQPKEQPRLKRSFTIFIELGIGTNIIFKTDLGLNNIVYYFLYFC